MRLHVHCPIYVQSPPTHVHNLLEQRQALSSPIVITHCIQHHIYTHVGRRYPRIGRLYTWIGRDGLGGLV